MKLSSEDLKAFSRSAHFWRFLPVDVIREIMVKSNLGEKVGAFYNDVPSGSHVSRFAAWPVRILKPLPAVS